MCGAIACAQEELRNENSFFAIEAKPGAQDAMERDGCGVGTSRGDEVPTLKVREGALDGASGEAGGASNGLMRHADRPVGLLGCLTIEVKVDDERG